MGNRHAGQSSSAPKRRGGSVNPDPQFPILAVVNGEDDTKAHLPHLRRLRDTFFMGEPFEYVGDELEVFAGAVRWKRYFGTQLRPFIRGNVLEVGAGLGSTTKVLYQDEVESWTCLEPDVKLVD